MVLADRTAHEHHKADDPPPAGHVELRWRAALGEMLKGYAVIVVLLLAVGVLLTHVVDGSVGRWDTDVNRWFASHRIGTWNSATGAMTFMLDTFSVIGVALVAVVLFSWRRHYRAAFVIVAGLVLEITVFLSVTFVVARPRPDVVRLSSTPMTSSFPSGHTAAAVVLYGGIALGLSYCNVRSALRVLFWVFAAVVVLAVAVSRVYRGMHHPTDVAAGAAFGTACLWFSWLSARSLFDDEGVSHADRARRAARRAPVARELTT